jgi:hypothetical protein
MANNSDSWEVEITLQYEDGTPVNVATAAGAIFAVYQEPGKILQQFSKEVKDGFTTLTAAALANAATGVVSLFLNVDKTVRAIGSKPLKAEARISLTNANFSGGVQVVSATDIELEPVTKLIQEGQAP